MVLPLINSLALFAAGYFLGEQSQENAPQSSDYQPPYEPPFAGGQCTNIEYNISITVNYKFAGDDVTETVSGGRFLGAIQSVEAVKISEAFINLRIVWNSGNSTYLQQGWYANSQISGFNIVSVSLSPTGGVADACGNLPNPNPSEPTSSSGLAQNGFNPNSQPNTELAAPIVPFLPSFLAALNAALAAAAAAANALDGIKAVAEAIAAIADLLKKIRDDLNEKEKEKDKNKEVLSYQFGKIEKDGFLRLYPSNAFADSEAFQLDVLITAIPLGYGKYFGRFSPNYFEYKRLGHIAFVSASFGIIERKYIEFGRSSFSVPKGSVGFYYHLGLDGIIKANASAIYLREVEQIE